MIRRGLPRGWLLLLLLPCIAMMLIEASASRRGLKEDDDDAASAFSTTIAMIPKQSQLLAATGNSAQNPKDEDATETKGASDGATGSSKEEEEEEKKKKKREEEEDDFDKTWLRERLQTLGFPPFLFPQCIDYVVTNDEGTYETVRARLLVQNCDVKLIGSGGGGDLVVRFERDLAFILEENSISSVKGIWVLGWHEVDRPAYVDPTQTPSEGANLLLATGGRTRDFRSSSTRPSSVRTSRHVEQIAVIFGEPTALGVFWDGEMALLINRSQFLAPMICQSS